MASGCASNAPLSISIAVVDDISLLQVQKDTAFKLANEKDALLGNHAADDEGNPIGRTVINGNEKLEQPTYMCAAMPRFVETRGGDYFFIPSLTALRMIGEGIIDPT